MNLTNTFEKILSAVDGLTIENIVTTKYQFVFGLLDFISTRVDVTESLDWLANYSQTVCFMSRTYGSLCKVVAPSVDRVNGIPDSVLTVAASIPKLQHFLESLIQNLLYVITSISQKLVVERAEMTFSAVNIISGKYEELVTIIEAVTDEPASLPSQKELKSLINKYEAAVRQTKRLLVRTLPNPEKQMV